RILATAPEVVVTRGSIEITFLLCFSLAGNQFICNSSSTTSSGGSRCRRLLQQPRGCEIMKDTM
ncbi:hypothetical protein ACJX0J_021627, partial [Zea mays]